MKNKIELIPVNEFGSEITVGGYGFDKFIEKPKQEINEQSQMYSEEDLREAFRQGMENMDYSEMYGFDSKLTEQEWFEQFKKK
jgi:aryl-alcohol dehydrogenase-like predicted oxidoreductase